MDANGRKRRNWLIFWALLIGIPAVAYVAYNLALARSFSVI
jgi:hypothetical protein